MHISTVSAIRNVQQEGRQRVTRFVGVLRVPRLTACETKRSVGERALEPIAGEPPSKRERVIAHNLRQISADLMTVGRFGNVGDVLTPARVAVDSWAGNQRVSPRRGESANETTGKTNRRIQVRGCVGEKGRRVVLIRGPRVLNLKHEARIESMYVTGAPISTRD